MALFKILRGKREGLLNQDGTNLKEFHDGWAYFTTDDQKFYIDTNLGTKAEPNNQRLNVHSEYADKAGFAEYYRDDQSNPIEIKRQTLYTSSTADNSNNLGTLTINGKDASISMPTTTMHLGAIFYIGATPPTTARLWIDTNEGGFFKYRTEDNGVWKPVPIGWTE